VTPVVGQVEPVGLVVVRIGFLVNFSFLKLLTLLLAAAAAVERVARLGHASPC